MVNYSVTVEESIYIRVNSLFNKLRWGNWTDLQKKMKLDHFSMSYIRMNSKWKTVWRFLKKFVVLLFF